MLHDIYEDISQWGHNRILSYYFACLSRMIGWWGVTGDISGITQAHLGS